MGELIIQDETNSLQCNASLVIGPRKALPIYHKHRACAGCFVGLGWRILFVL
jgi:hypothetical protein